MIRGDRARVCYHLPSSICPRFALVILARLTGPFVLAKRGYSHTATSMLSHFRSSETVPKSDWKDLLLRRKLLFYTKGRGAIFSLHFFNTVFFFSLRSHPSIGDSAVVSVCGTPHFISNVKFLGDDEVGVGARAPKKRHHDIWKAFGNHDPGTRTALASICISFVLLSQAAEQDHSKNRALHSVRLGVCYDGKNKFISPLSVTVAHGTRDSGLGTRDSAIAGPDA